ncbi:AmmeMemoRadiSam system protein B [bacterium]|nr:AmmeMemoRadiSam system protein B [bacterium]
MIRPPAVNGHFYPKDGLALSNQIQDFLDVVDYSDLKAETINPIKGLISPHAGYSYSGLTAAHGFKAIEGQSIETAIILGPSHYVSFEGVSIFDGSFYETPLGLIPIETALAQELIFSSPNYNFFKKAHEKEHSIEVQLPFLQTLGIPNILSVIMGSENPNPKALADSIIEHADPEKTIIIASSDFSHFYDTQTAQKMDTLALETIKSKDIEQLVKLSEQKKIEMCGLHPIITLLLIMADWNITNQKILHSTNSGNVSGDTSRVVGYNSVAFY